MKKFYLAWAIFFLVLVTINYFENASWGIQMMFLWKYKSLTTIYPMLIACGIGEWVCITLFVQSLLRELQDKIDNGWLDL